MRVLAATGEAAKSGPIGLAVILVLCVACYFLFKSMSKHMRKVREEFPADEAPAADAPIAGEQPADGHQPVSEQPASSGVAEREGSEGPEGTTGADA